MNTFNPVLNSATLEGILRNKDQNFKRLNPEDTPAYFLRIRQGLGNLSQIFSNISTEDYDHTFIQPFIKLIDENLQCLQLKHAVSGKDQLDPFTINPQSGFPTFKDFNFLQLDQDNSKQILNQQLPPREKIIDMIRWGILGDRDIEHEQIILKRFNYFSKVSESDILPVARILSSKPELKSTEGGKRFYTLNWWGLEAGSNLPVFYRMWFAQDANSPQLHNDKEREGENPVLELFIQQSRRGVEDLKTFVWHLDQRIDELHPKEIRKYTIGPYYDSQTETPKGLERAFEGVTNPSAMRFKVEMVLSTAVTRKTLKGNWEYLKAFLTGHYVQKEIYSSIQVMENGLIVPFRVAQKLRKRDEYGCKVYGVTEGGEVVI